MAKKISLTLSLQRIERKATVVRKDVRFKLNRGENVFNKGDLHLRIGN